MMKARACGHSSNKRTPFLEVIDWRMAGIFVLSVVTAIASSAQTFTSLFSFDYANGSGPYLAGLIQGTDGEFYGTTTGGGANGPYGAIFKISRSGALTVL